VTAFSAAALLCACVADTGNEASNAPDPAATVPSGNGAAGPGEAPPVQQPGEGAQAPEPSSDVALSAAPATTTEGSTVTLTLRNGSGEQIGYNLCTSALETSAGQPVPSSRVCTMELRTLEPGKTATYPYELPVNMTAGNYRFVTQVEWMGSGRRSAVRSNSIAVTTN